MGVWVVLCSPLLLLRPPDGPSGSQLPPPAAAVLCLLHTCDGINPCLWHCSFPCTSTLLLPHTASSSTPCCHRTATYHTPHTKAPIPHSSPASLPPPQVPLWQTIVKHRSLFFPHRGLFVPTMIHSLARLGCNASSPMEHRKLALDMVALLLDWERQAGQVGGLWWWWWW